jgi:flagellar basal-body rod protein FlgG
MTGQPFDVMIEGPGFFSVQLPNGEVGFTRNGAFKRDATGKFMLSGGQKLIPEITIPQNSLGVTINPDGQVRSMQADGNEAVIGNITLVNFANEEGLLSSGNGVYKSTIASGPPLPGQPGSIGYGNLPAGALEGSNVDVATSMVDMIQTQRAYELNTKVMGVADQMMNATVNIKQ